MILNYYLLFVSWYLLLAICYFIFDNFYLKLAISCKNLFPFAPVVRLIIFHRMAARIKRLFGPLAIRRGGMNWEELSKAIWNKVKCLQICGYQETSRGKLTMCFWDLILYFCYAHRTNQSYLIEEKNFYEWAKVFSKQIARWCVKYWCCKWLIN